MNPSLAGAGKTAGVFPLRADPMSDSAHAFRYMDSWTPNSGIGSMQIDCHSRRHARSFAFPASPMPRATESSCHAMKARTRRRFGSPGCRAACFTLVDMAVRLDTPAERQESFVRGYPVGYNGRALAQDDRHQPTRARSPTRRYRPGRHTTQLGGGAMMKAHCRPVDGRDAEQHGVRP